MAEQNNTSLVKREQDDKTIVVNNLIVRTVFRKKLDTEDFRTAYKIADYIALPNRVRLYDIYDDIGHDAHLAGIIGKRLRAVRNKRLRYVDGDGKEIEEMESFTRSKELRRIRGIIFKSLGWELSGLEFIPGKKLAFKEIPVKHIKPNLGVITIEQMGTEPCINGDYNANPFLWVIQNEEEKFGFLLKVTPWVIYKRGDVGDWAQYIELFGQPNRVYSYEPGDTEGKKVLEDAMENAAGALSMMIPNTVKYETDDAKQTNADGKLQESFKNTCDEQMSICVLGQTETTKSSNSSGYAQSQTHQEQQYDITSDDMEYELQWLNDEKFISILKSYGIPVVEGGRFEHEEKANPVTLQERMKVDKDLATLVPIADDYFYETYKVPKPDNYEQLKKQKLQEQQQAKQATSQPEPKAPQPKKDKKKPKTGKLSFEEKQSFWNKLRTDLADFFDPART